MSLKRAHAEHEAEQANDPKADERDRRPSKLRRIIEDKHELLGTDADGLSQRDYAICSCFTDVRDVLIC